MSCESVLSPGVWVLSRMCLRLTVSLSAWDCHSLEEYVALPAPHLPARCGGLRSPWSQGQCTREYVPGAGGPHFWASSPASCRLLRAPLGPQQPLAQPLPVLSGLQGRQRRPWVVWKPLLCSQSGLWEHSRELAGFEEEEETLRPVPQAGRPQGAVQHQPC